MWKYIIKNSQLCAFYQSALGRKLYHFFLFHFPPITPDTQATDLQMALGSETVFSAFSCVPVLWNDLPLDVRIASSVG